MGYWEHCDTVTSRFRLLDRHEFLMVLLLPVVVLVLSTEFTVVVGAINVHHTEHIIVGTGTTDSLLFFVA